MGLPGRLRVDVKTSALFRSGFLAQFFEVIRRFFPVLERDMLINAQPLVCRRCGDLSPRAATRCLHCKTPFKATVRSSLPSWQGCSRSMRNQKAHRFEMVRM